MHYMHYKVYIHHDFYVYSPVLLTQYLGHCWHTPCTELYFLRIRCGWKMGIVSMVFVLLWPFSALHGSCGNSVARCLCTIRVNSLCSCLCFYRMLTQWCLYCILPRSVVIWCRITVYVIVLTWISVSSDLSSHLLSIDTACPSTGALNWLSIGLSMSVSCAHISSLIGLCVYVPMYPHIVPWFSYISTIYLSTDLSLFMFPEPSWSIFRPLPWTTWSAKKPFLQQQSAWLLRKPPLPCHRGGEPSGWGGGCGGHYVYTNSQITLHTYV